MQIQQIEKQQQRKQYEQHSHRVMGNNKGGVESEINDSIVISY